MVVDMKTNVTLNLPHPKPAQAPNGCSDRSGTTYGWDEVVVEADGSVLAWDDVAGRYSRTTGDALPEERRALARELAAGIRAGTHYTAGGFVYRKKAS